MSTYLVLGTGMQGTAAAYDLIQHGGATRLILADSDAARLAAAAERLGRLTDGCSIERLVVDASCRSKADSDALEGAFAEAELCMNCLPYRYSLRMTRMALDHGTHIADLGGNTAVVREQLSLAADHERSDAVAVLPDCGLMPGMGNLFAAWCLAELGGRADSIQVRCGGLPTDPLPPLDYALLFNVYGLINEYFGKAQVLRDGQLVELDTFTELEPVAIPALAAAGLEARDCEAFITSGGLSTTPWSFSGSVGQLDYKTVRYAGHWAKFKLLVDLGLLGEDALELPIGAPAVPRDVLAACLESKLSFPDVDDLAFLRCTARSGERTLELEVFDRKDAATGFTAMERTTAFSATACLYGVTLGKVAVGAGPIERSVDPAWFLEALEERGIAVARRTG